MRRTVFIFVLMIAPLAVGQRRRAVIPPAVPPCLGVEGTPAVTFTRDEGHTLAPTTERLEGVDGTDLFRYDDSTRSLTKTHNDYNDINAIAFSREKPSVMYLGLETEMVR